MSNIMRGNNIGMKKETTFKTAVEPTTDDQFLAETFSPPTGAMNFAQDTGDVGVGLTTTNCALDYQEQPAELVTKLRWDDKKIVEIFASLFGIYGSSTPAGGGVSHNLTLKEVLATDISHTLAWDEGAQTKSLAGTKVKSGTIALDQIFKLTTGFLGSVHAAESGFTEPLVVTAESDGRCFFSLKHATVKINDETGGALSAETALLVNNITIAIARGYIAQTATAGNDTVSSIDDDTEPVFNITLIWPKKDGSGGVNESLITDYQAGTRKKMEIVFDSGVVITGASTETYKMSFYFPSLMYSDAPVYDQNTPIQVTGTWKSMKTKDGTPTGMSGAVPYMTIVNAIAALTGYPAS